MNSTLVGLIVFACTSGGLLTGMWLRSVLPKPHFEGDAKDTIKLGTGLIATMTALVLGLVTASAKSSFDAMNGAVKQSAMQILALDRLLARYGPETAEIRSGLQQIVANRIDAIWGTHPSKPPDLDPIRPAAGPGAEGLAQAIRALRPHDDVQRALQTRAVDLTESLLQTRWLMLAGGDNSVPLPFLVILTCWLTLTFSSFGLFAPRNATVTAILLVCSLSVASAVFLVLEMDSPFDGLLKVSGEPLRHAYSRLNR